VSVSEVQSPSASQFPHRRYNPLRRQWVLVSPHRTQRPWQGEVNPSSGFSNVHYDPECYLCPGNTRAGEHITPPYESVFIFENDYAALLPDSPEPPADASPLLRAERERGRCLVVCFHPDHSLTIPRMELPDIRLVVDAWTGQYAELCRQPELRYVQIFENRGAMMGASNPHPHCQIWATEHIPDEPALEIESQKAWLAANHTCLLCDYLKVESQQAIRVVCENEDFLVVVPWWAVWPFETLVLAKRHTGSLLDFEDREKTSLADILRQTTTRYDNLFQTSFPYTMGFHQTPCDRKTGDGDPHPEWHFHAHYYPPLLRSATVRKFMVGFEMLGMPQRDITPEAAAERLRSLSPTHFTAKPG
jgi:UDPglucose--hexose-1-phosphate uridylyltransferase